MTAKPTILLILSLTTIALSAPTDPNDTVSGPKFEISTVILPWTVYRTIGGQSVPYYEPGSIRPVYVAEIILPHDRLVNDRDYYLEKVMQSPLTQKLSQPQKDFLTQGLGIGIEPHSNEIPDHSAVRLYGVSESDVKITALALLDSFAADARNEINSDKNQLKDRQERLRQNQAALPGKEKQFKEVQRNYEVAKSSTYPLNSEEEAAQLAKELILQMDRQAKTLEIDRAGVRGKLDVIDEYLSKPDLNRNVTETLEAQRIELLIELSGLEARREAIRQIRDQQRRFCTLLGVRNELKDSVEQLKTALKQDEEAIPKITATLQHPSGYLVPPKIYENKVILYPIEAEDSQN